MWTRTWLVNWTRRHPLRVRDVSMSRLWMRTARSFIDIRVMGLAAEMNYYAVLSLFPLIAALGASLGFVARVVGTEQAERAEMEAFRAFQAVFSPEATDTVVAPLIQGLLQHERTGFALGGFMISVFFASTVFRSAIEGLDTAYRVQERSGTVALWVRGVLFALFGVVVGTMMLIMLVVDPLFGLGEALSARIELRPAFELAWAIARWPVAFGIAVAFLTLLYRVGPNVRNTWSESLPGAIFGVSSIVIVSAGFRFYIEITGLLGPVIEDPQDAVEVALQVIGVLMASLFWLWINNMAMLTGGVINAELRRIRPQSIKGRKR